VDILLPVLSNAGIKNVKVYHTAPRLKDVKRNYSDITKVRQKLCWQSQNSLPAGLKQTLDWFLRNG